MTFLHPFLGLQNPNIWSQPAKETVKYSEKQIVVVRKNWQAQNSNSNFSSLFSEHKIPRPPASKHEFLPTRQFQVIGLFRAKAFTILFYEKIRPARNYYR